MKTKSLLMAMATLAIASCSQNEVTEINPDMDRTIGLDVYTGVQTKGAETTTPALKTGTGFGIFAYKTSSAGWSSEKATVTPDFMYNVQATWSTDSWGYNTIRFWPTNEDKVSFFAYAPYQAQNAADKKTTLSAQSEAGAPKLTFEVNTSWKDMVDLVTDRRTGIQDLTSKDNSGTVQFKFSHVLTQVANIKVKPDTDLGSDTKIFVTGLKLVPGSTTLFSKAVYKFDDDSWEATPTASYFTTEQDLSGILDTKAANQWGYTESSIDVSSKANATALFKDKEALYFIPVNNNSGTSNEGDLNLKISYDIVTKVSESSNSISTVTDKEVKLPAGTFKKGTKHTYVLTIKMNAIKITVDDTMEGWADGGDSAIEAGK